MIPGIYNITAYRNDTLQKTITVVDSAGSPVSFATATMKMQVRTKPDGDVLLELTEGDGLTVGGAGNNVITISKVVSITGCGAYYYDLQATFASGVVSTYIKGTFIVQKDITLS
jgi:hypothetical protein